MSIPLFTDFLDNIKIPIDDPNFYQRTFTIVSKQRVVSDDEVKKYIEDEFDSLSRFIDRSKIQDGPTVRALFRIRKLVNLLIDDKGELNKVVLGNAIVALKNSLYSLGPLRQFDAKHQEQLLRALMQLQESKEMQILLKNVSAPYMNRYAEQLIRETLQLPVNSRVNDPETRRAVLSAWLCLLRQSVGSCFATAPAMIVHDHQSPQFFKDIIELLATSRLKRTFGGNEYSVPLAASWGAGDLRRPIALPTGSLADTADIWSSPGMLVAMVAAGLIPEKLSLKERISRAKSLLLPLLNPESNESSEILSTPEDLLKRVILGSLKMTPEDLKEKESALKSALVGSPLLQTSAAASGKSQPITTFNTKFEAACIAFKTMADNALLKSWEFTVASFAETKTNFARWNLYSSLGLGPQEQGGIGYVIYTLLKDKLDQVNREIEEVKIQHEQAMGHLRYLETRLRTASSEKDAEWIKSEYRVRRYAFEQIEEGYNFLQYQAKRYASLLDQLVDIYSDLFPAYFQEVYDADMHEVSIGPYDDSPAGFRLVFKYGRANTAQWNRIQTPSEFIEALASFFIATESEISNDPSMEGIEKDISDITTAIVMQIRTPEFLETAFYRMAKAHHVAPIKDPLEHLDSIEKKPWAYTSGGTMGTLVSCYWKREEPPTEASRWVENPTELLVFLVDLIKQMPPKILEEFEKDSKKALLMHSPTHAFLLKPGVSPFKELWKNNEFTYTYIRDNYIHPAEKFIDKINLNQAMAQFLIEKIALKVPVNYRYYFKQVFAYVPIGVTPPEFRSHLVHVMEKERGLAYGRILSSDEIDGLLYSLLPLASGDEIKDIVRKIFKKLPNVGPSFLMKLETLLEQLPITMLPEALVSSQALQDMVKAFLCLIYQTTSTPYDYHWHVSKVCKELGYAMPMPVIVADTNWVRDEFGFLVNPGTGHFDFWQIDYTGSTGNPISSWKQWLNGSQKERTWGVYTHPQEYVS